MTPIGTPELVLLVVALGGMTAAATWAVIELKRPRRWKKRQIGLGPAWTTSPGFAQRREAIGRCALGCRKRIFATS